MNINNAAILVNRPIAKQIPVTNSRPLPMYAINKGYGSFLITSHSAYPFIVSGLNTSSPWYAISRPVIILITTNPLVCQSGSEENSLFITIVLFAAVSFSSTQYFVWLALIFRYFDKLTYIGRIKREHIIMTGYNTFCMDGF